MLVEFAERRGISADKLLEPLQVSLEDLLDHSFKVPPATFEHLISRTIGLTGQFGLGYQLGLQMKEPHYELIGQAVKNSKTLRDTIEVCLAFSRFHSSSIRISKTESEEEVTLHFEPASDDYDPETWAMEMLIISFASAATSLTAKPIRGSARLMIEKPAVYEDIKHLLPGSAEFGCKECSLTFPREIMDYPIVAPDPDSARTAKAFRKQELGQLREQHSVGELVESMLFDEGVGFYSMEQIADKLDLSTRSLQRHLKEESLAFSDIVEKVRRQQAMRLLSESNLSVSRISTLLGYSDVANFSRAFRRWSGESPRTYRQRTSGGPPAHKAG